MKEKKFEIDYCNWRLPKQPTKMFEINIKIQKTN